MSSDYYRALDVAPRERYRQKLTFRGEELPDPLDTSLRQHAFVTGSTGSRRLPLVHVGDIYAYLVEGTCFYSREQFKSFKLSDGYNSFISGKVRQLRCFSAAVGDSAVVLVAADVEASQTVKKVHQPWTLVGKDGTIISAHCTCMAGLGEACSHVSALLFRVEAEVKHGLNDPSSTSMECRWISPSTSAQAAEVVDIRFVKPETARKKKRTRDPASEAPQQRQLASATDDQVQTFLKRVKEIAPSTLLLSSLTDSEGTDTCSDSEGQDLAAPSAMFPDSIVQMYTPHDQVAAQGLKLTTLQCGQIEVGTRGQAHSGTWFEQRQGRITASILGRVLSCRNGQEGIVSEIMGYVKAPDVPSLRHGKASEGDARRAFVLSEERNHRDFKVENTGLFVCPEKPFLGASPDGLVTCSCCTKAVLEIKCPSTCKGKKLRDPDTKLPSYLTKELQLEATHDHYAQVQAQMALSGAERAFFVVYTGVDISVEMIHFDIIFWDTAVGKAELFFFSHVFLEFRSRDLQKKLERAKKSCICKGAKTGAVVQCSVCGAVAHLKCLGLKRRPKIWICSDCQDCIEEV